MKPVHQTSFYPAGNCYAACVASILELPVEEVPDFYHQAVMDSAPFYQHVSDWLASRDLGVLRVLPMVDGVWVAPAYFGERELFFIASGKSPRHDCHHAVVWKATGQATAPAHDPHPEGGFLKGDPTSFDLIVPLKEAR